MFTQRCCTFLALLLSLGWGQLRSQTSGPVDIPVFIIIGQSNADGSAFADSTLDARLDAWYTSSSNPGTMKIWYCPSRAVNGADHLGHRAPYATDAPDSLRDAPAGWMDLWYKNDQSHGRSAMQMIHGAGTWSTAAAGRRGIEGQFGRTMQDSIPSTDLRVIKLGVSGSGISTWADSLDSHNWRYFMNHVYRPAITDLLASGRRPVLTGVWWMQGCADMHQDSAYYAVRLQGLVDSLHLSTGFPNGQIYIGLIAPPGSRPDQPSASRQFGPAVRAAQLGVIAANPSTMEAVETSQFTFQYEPAFEGYLHLDHQGVCDAGHLLASEMARRRPQWELFTTPGEWRFSEEEGQWRFIPSLGSPLVTYSTDPSAHTVTASLDYGTWQEQKTHPLREVN